MKELPANSANSSAIFFPSCSALRFALKKPSRDLNFVQIFEILQKRRNCIILVNKTGMAFSLKGRWKGTIWLQIEKIGKFKSKYFLPCQCVKINPNFEILLSYWSSFKSWSIFTHWHGKKYDFKTWFYIIRQQNRCAT